jgi:hypothetical protein
MEVCQWSSLRFCEMAHCLVTGICDKNYEIANTCNLFITYLLSKRTWLELSIMHLIFLSLARVTKKPILSYWEHISFSYLFPVCSLCQFAVTLVSSFCWVCEVSSCAVCHNWVNYKGVITFSYFSSHILFICVVFLKEGNLSTCVFPLFFTCFL